MGHSVLELVELVLFGVVVGGYGTLVGAGGGFVMVPVFRLVFGFSAQESIGTSLVIVFFNAISGTVAYARARRIDYGSGWRLAVATLPGAALGARLSVYFSTRTFDAIFGAVLLLTALALVLRPTPVRGDRAPEPSGQPGRWRRELVDAAGHRFVWDYNLTGAVLASVAVGFFSSIFGVGGGIIHVPLLVYAFGFPAHLATATSHFILAITSLTGGVTHLALGHVRLAPALTIGAGAIAGAQLAGRIAHRVKGALLLRLLALALVAVGVRLLVSE